MRPRLSRERYNDLKIAAADLIEDYGLAYPLEPREIADILGAQIVEYRHGLPDLASALRTQDGFTESNITEYGYSFRIHLNSAQPAIRQRFTITHECGHIWLDHLIENAHNSHEIMEIEANFFASYLLAPDVLIQRWLPDFTITAIASQFSLSTEAATNAHRRYVNALNLGVIGQAHDLRIASSARRRTSDKVRRSLKEA